MKKQIERKMSNKKHSECFCVDLPATSYLDAWTLQQDLARARRTGILDRDLVLLLEHTPVFTGHTKNSGAGDIMILEY